VDDITLTLGTRELPLKLTMHRVRLLAELTGVDVLNGDASELGQPANLSRTLYALAGGPGTNLSVEEFEDELTPAGLRDAASLLVRVFQRDAGGGEGNAPVDAPASKS
jgi:hypothetical protein